MINDHILINLFQLTAIFHNIFKVDCGDCVESSSLQHAASQAPVLDVRAELQDLIIIITLIHPCHLNISISISTGYI